MKESAYGELFGLTCVWCKAMDILVPNNLLPAPKPFRISAFKKKDHVFVPTGSFWVYDRAKHVNYNMLFDLGQFIRRTWLVQKDPEFLKTEKPFASFPDKNIEEYHLQPVQIDETAFAVLFFERETGKNILHMLLPSMQDPVKKRMKELTPWFDTIKVDYTDLEK